MRKTPLFLLLCIAFALSACVPKYETVTTYLAPHTASGKRCAKSCLYDRTNCLAQCQNSEIACSHTAEIIVMPEYERYAAQKVAWGKPIDRCPSDFANYKNCRYNCGCESMYDECYTACGGMLITTHHCVAHCPTNLH